METDLHHILQQWSRLASVWCGQFLSNLISSLHRYNCLKWDHKHAHVPSYRNYDVMFFKPLRTILVLWHCYWQSSWAKKSEIKINWLIGSFLTFGQLTKIKKLEKIKKREKIDIFELFVTFYYFNAAQINKNDVIIAPARSVSIFIVQFQRVPSL